MTLFVYFIVCLAFFETRRLGQIGSLTDNFTQFLKQL